MAISYPIAFPSSLVSMEVGFIAENIVGVWTSPQSLATQVYQFPGQRWRATIKVPPLKSVILSENLIGWLLSLQGRAGSFYLSDLSHRNPYGVATGTPVCHGTQTPGSNQLLLRGFTASVTGILKAGDWIQVATDSTQRLYKATSDANSDSSGYCTVNVWPNVRTANADGVPIVLTNAAGIFMLDDDTNWTVDLARTYGVAIAASEII